MTCQYKCSNGYLPPPGYDEGDEDKSSQQKKIVLFGEDVNFPPPLLIIMIVMLNFDVDCQYCPHLPSVFITSVSSTRVMVQNHVIRSTVEHTRVVMLSGMIFQVRIAVT
jgi:hypothetical protein